METCDSSQPHSTWSYDMLHGPDGKLPHKLQNIPQHLIETICHEIMDGDTNVRWDDIAGLHQAKKCATEMAILPLLHPNIFKGCSSPGRGLLLFGPPMHKRTRHNEEQMQKYISDNISSSEKKAAFVHRIRRQL